MRSVGVVTVARSDFGIYRPVLKRIQKDPSLSLHLIVAGAHLSRDFGYTVQEIEQEGFAIGDRVDMLVPSDAPEAIATSMGQGTIGFAQSYVRFRPDILLVLGDRFEMHASVVASLPFGIPVAHIHGGESTEGLIDEPIRHSITKMSHLHFVSTEAHARRVIQMGEAPWRVVVSGAPGLDNLRSLQMLSPEQIEEQHGIRLRAPTLLVTFHPVTLEYEQTASHVEELLAALADVDAGIVFTYPNADTSGRLVINRIDDFVRHHDNASVAPSLGSRGYFSLMAHAEAMVGNSSSGIIEAASFELPVVNVGNRQRGRLHGANVIDSTCDRDAISGALDRATSPEFRAGLAGMANPYGDGHAAKRIVDGLKNAKLNSELLMKHFHEVAPGAA